MPPGYRPHMPSSSARCLPKDHHDTGDIRVPLLCYLHIQHRVLMLIIRQLRKTDVFRHTSSCLLLDRLTVSRLGTKWVRIDNAVYDTCRDPRVYRPPSWGASVRGSPQVPMRRRELRGRPAGRGLPREQFTRTCTIVPVSLYTGTGQPSRPITSSAALCTMVIRLPHTLSSSRGRTQRSACWGRSNSRSWTPALRRSRRRMCSRTNSKTAKRGRRGSDEAGSGE